MVDLLLNHIYRYFGLWDKLITDCGPEFASQVMQAIHKQLSIISALSMAYHLETDGETKQFNQELEQYLRMFCNYWQDDWVKHLPFAEFLHNIRAHSATGKALFELLHGYLPCIISAVCTDSYILSIEAHLKTLEQLRKEVEASLTNAAEVIKAQYSNHLLKHPPFKVGDLVTLNGKNIETTRPSAKLSNKLYGPFKITEAIGTVNF